jgi:hypothetical protein
MTRRLGGNGRRDGLAVLATASLAAGLAFGGTTVGCGGGGSGNGPDDTGPGVMEAGPDSPVTMDAPPDNTKPDASEAAPPADSGPETTADVNMPEVMPMPTAATPTCSPMPGMFAAAQSVTLADTTTGATIFYTLDHTNPNQNSTVFSAGAPLSISQTTEVRAYATAPGFQPSAVQSCTYTITIPPGTVLPPVAAPQGGPQNNDFPASLTTMTPGATICYTLDGSKPVCTNGACVAPSQTYSSASRISINGTVTTPGTGVVVLNALACAAGSMDGDMAPVTYTLVVATPSLHGPDPDPATHTYTNAGTINPTVASITSGATGLYTTDGTNMPSCTNGKTLGALPSNAISLAESAGSQTIYAVACKPGYADSAVAKAGYSIALNAPGVGSTVVPGTYNALVPVTLDDSKNANATGEYSCVTTDGTTPTCNTAASGCTGGTKYTSGAAIKFATNLRTSTGGSLNVDQTKVNAVACSPSFLPSSPGYAGGAYTLQLDPLQFMCKVSPATTFTDCTATGATVPNGGNVAVQINENVKVAGDEPYDFVCYSTDGTTKPDCVCNTTAPSTLKVATTLPVTLATAFTGAATVQAIGCLNSKATGGNGTAQVNGDVFEAATGQLVIGKVGQMNQPTITPTNPSINNATTAHFINNNAAGSDGAYFCYTLDNTAPATATATTCYATGSTHGSTVCTTSATAPTKTSTDGPAISATGTWVRAIACDAATGQPLTPSIEAAPIQYQLVVGTPVVTVPSPLNLGGAILITSTTPGALINYSTDGTTPDCTTAYAGVTTSTTADSNGLFEAIYWAMGAETGKLTVIGCKTGYSTSPALAPISLSYAVGQPLVLDASGNTVATGATLDDYIGVTISEPPHVAGTAGGGGGVAGLWFCAGPTPSCGTINGQCGGTNSQAVAGTCSNVTLTGQTAHSVGQPGGTPSCIGTGLTLPDTTTFGPNPQVLSCAPSTVVALGKITPSAGQSMSYTFQNSAVGLTSKAAMTSAGAVTFAGALTATAPDGDANSNKTGSTGGNGNPNGTGSGTGYICGCSLVSTSSCANPAVQPSSCAAYAAAAPTGWTCVNSTTGGLGVAGPTLSFGDQGINTTYSFFSCKDGMTWSTGTAAVTFAPYLYPGPGTFAATGAVSDFATTGENFATADTGAAAYVTFDATNLYVGFEKGSAILTTDIVDFYIGKGGGSSSSPTSHDTIEPTGTADLPSAFNPVFHVFWKGDNTLNGADQLGSGGWAAATAIAAVKFNNGASFVEFTIPKTALAAANGDVHLLGGLWTGAARFGAWPVITGTGLTANTDAAWKEWQGENFTYAFTPNDANRTNWQ